MEERLVLVRERDVDHDGRRDGQEARPQRRAKLPGVVRREVFEDERGVDASDGFELRGWHGTVSAAQLSFLSGRARYGTTPPPLLCVLLQLTSVGGSSIGLGVPGLDFALGDDMIID